MKFAPLQELLQPCVGRPWALGAFDTLALDMTQGIFDAASAENSPLIIMCLPGLMPRQAWPSMIASIAAEVDRTHLPVALHFDHCTAIEQIAAGLKLGITGAMIDGSALPLEQNIALTRQAVELCHPAGVAVEGELGHVGHNDENISADDSLARLTQVEEAARFVAETGVDALAVSVGNVHGLYRGRPHIDFERLAALRAVLDIPLVMHGGSDTPEDDMRRAIETGLDKINIWTDVRVAYLESIHGHLTAGPVAECNIATMILDARATTCAVARQKMRLFGSPGKAGTRAQPDAAAVDTDIRRTSTHE